MQLFFFIIYSLIHLVVSQVAEHEALQLRNSCHVALLARFAALAFLAQLGALVLHERPVRIAHGAQEFRISGIGSTFGILVGTFLGAVRPGAARTTLTPTATRLLGTLLTGRLAFAVSSFR